MNDIVLPVIGKLLGALLVCAVGYLAPKVKTWFDLKNETEATNITITVIRECVKAADQLFKDDDPTGEIRNNYVKERLKELGYLITEEINAYIEAEVFSLKGDK